MARVLTTKDGYALMNALVRQATGQDSMAAIDASTFVSAGETVLATGIENTLNSLSLVIGRTFAAVRPYQAKLRIINAINTGVYSHRLRKISYYAQDVQHSGYFNTDIFTNFDQGYTAGENESGTPPTPNSTKSQWEMTLPRILECNFGGSTTWQFSITYLLDKLEQAFNGVESFNEFVQGILVERGNDVESQKEAWNRMILVAAMASRYYLHANSLVPDAAINLTTAFNNENNTSYTTAQLQTVYYKEFFEWFTAKVKEISDRMTERSVHFHDPMTRTENGIDYHILRHTPYDRQRFIFFGPLFRKAEATVFPEIFRPEYLDMDKQMEKVEYWQSNDTDADREKINFNSAYLDADGTQHATGAIALNHVVGFIYDADALLSDFVLTRTLTTPVEARKGYYNSWLTFAKNAIIDQTENGVLLYMAD